MIHLIKWVLLVLVTLLMLAVIAVDYIVELVIGKSLIDF